MVALTYSKLFYSTNSKKGAVMVDFLEINLMPIGIKKLMSVVRRISICTVVCMFAFLIYIWGAGVFDCFVTGIGCSLLFLFVIIPILRPGIVFDKVSQSTVRFVADQMYLLDKKGRCWRTIDYKRITAVRVEEVSGFFYGQNQDLFRGKYVCVFLNGLTNIPNVSYAQLFTEKDFIMFGFNEEAIHWLYQNLHEVEICATCN